MSCENKLTNLVFKNKENSVKTQCASFFLPIFPLYIYIYRIKKKNQNEMHEYNAMQHQRQKRKIQKTKEQKIMVTKEKQ